MIHETPRRDLGVCRHFEHIRSQDTDTDQYQEGHPRSTPILACLIRQRAANCTRTRTHHFRSRLRSGAPLRSSQQRLV